MKRFFLAGAIAVATALLPRVALADGGYLGVYLVDEADSKDGALVEDVEPDSPAQKAGLHKNDLVVGWDNDKITHSKALIERLLKASPGEKHTLRLSRDGWERDLAITFGKRNEPTPPKKEEEKPAAHKESGGNEGERGYLGITLKQNPDGPGAFVNSIESGSPAEKGGLKKSDIIVGVDGKKIDDYSGFIELVRGTRVGQKLKLRVAREGWERDVEVVLGNRPTERAAPPPAAKPAEPKKPSEPAKKRPAFLGVALLDGDGKGPLKIDEVAAGSPAEKAGLKAGDVIIGVSDKKVGTIGEFEGALAAKFAGDEVVISIEREGWKRQVKVLLGDRPGE